MQGGNKPRMNYFPNRAEGVTALWVGRYRPVVSGCCIPSSFLTVNKLLEHLTEKGQSLKIEPILDMEMEEFEFKICVWVMLTA